MLAISLPATFVMAEHATVHLRPCFVFDWLDTSIGHRPLYYRVRGLSCGVRVRIHDKTRPGTNMDLESFLNSNWKTCTKQSSAINRAYTRLCGGFPFSRALPFFHDNKVSLQIKLCKKTPCAAQVPTITPLSRALNQGELQKHLLTVSFHPLPLWLHILINLSLIEKGHPSVTINPNLIELRLKEPWFPPSDPQS